MPNEPIFGNFAKRHPTMYSFVFETLRDEILAGRIPTGTRLNIEEIQTRLGVSRTPVREALKQLSSMGLVENQPHRGTYIKELSVDDIIEIYQIRSALEGMIARISAKKLSSDDLNKLKDLCSRMENGSRDIGHAGFREMNEAFHQILRNAISAPILVELSMTYYRQSTISRALSIELPGSFESVCREHKDIVAALISRDPDAADSAMKTHYLNTADRIAKSMGKKE